MTTHDIGHLIWQTRTERGISQLDLFELTGISLTTLSNIETGKTNPRLSTLRTIAEALEVRLVVEFAEF